MFFKILKGYINFCYNYYIVIINKMVIIRIFGVVEFYISYKLEIRGRGINFILIYNELGYLFFLGFYRGVLFFFIYF